LTIYHEEPNILEMTYPTEKVQNDLDAYQQSCDIALPDLHPKQIPGMNQYYVS